jgi:DNA-binding beta-propeller fold protein YncE
VWVPDRENRRLQIFDAKGKFLDQWTDLGRPTDVVIDKDEIVYVSELLQRVSIFTIKGKLLARWGSQGENQETALFLAPHTLAVDSRGDIYVGEVAKTFAKIDRGARTVQKFVRKR